MTGGQWSAKMTKRIRAKYKIDRRLGENVWGRPKSPLNRRESRPGQHGERRMNLIGLLERRLDAVVYRAKFVPTVFAARQFISHGHVRVNGRRVNISSYRCRPGDEIEVREKARQMPMVIEATKSGERDVPDYVDADHTKFTAKFVRVPAAADVPYPVIMEPNLVVEFYSR
jgi:small subunit ribosomal protein S4